MRLIDADALPKYTGHALSANEVAMAVENAPTIDAVEVIRCKRCPFCKSREGDFPWCERFEVGTQDDDYCEIDSVIKDKLQEGK